METIKDNEIIRFVDDESGIDKIILVKSNPNKATQNDIEDCIMSYVDAVENLDCEQLTKDVLDSFGMEYEILEPETFLF